MRLNWLIILGVFLALQMGSSEIARGADQAGPLRIVIDPGHGGDDRGLIGPGGLSEDALTMALARRFKTALEKEGSFQVVLTREPPGPAAAGSTAASPSLVDRSGLANGMRADLFISLHAGGATADQAQPYAVYVMALDLQAERPGLAGSRLENEEWDRGQAVYLGPARRLAQELDLALSEVLRVKRQGVIALPLAVLAGCRQPAVLIEVGSLADPEMERRLAGSGYREALARALLRGLESYRLWLERSGDS